VRVLLVDLETAWRGGQNQALLLLQGLQARGHCAELVAAAGGELAKRAGAAGITVHAVAGIFLRAQTAARIQRLTAAQKYDIVHANEPHALTSAWLARAHRRAPLVVSRRVGYPISRNRVARLRYDAAARIVAISRWSAARVVASGIAESKVAIVYEGIEIPGHPAIEERLKAREKWGVAADAPLFGCVGVLSLDKGQEWVIRGLAELRKKFPTAKLLLAGDGPCRARLQKLARDAAVSDAVIFAGFVSDVEIVYAALDVFLLPSFFEALSNALMSAMAYAIPSIAFDFGGPAEIIEDGQSGLLVEPANVEALRDAMTKIVGNATFAGELGAKGRQRVEQKFSAAQMVNTMIDVYEACATHGL
jgi:glycosyltransferase involved in cell wall biosynthesis